MDTGLGREGYSNIGQGRIDEILSVKSQDRREIFEEAAGISKYRHRKEETERKLASAEENLLRIGDKIAELELQVEPLRVQAEKAKQYLSYREVLRGLEVTVWLDTLEKLGQTAKKAEEDYHSAVFILEQAHTALDSLYANSEALAEQLRQLDAQMEQCRDGIAALEQQAKAQEGQTAVLQAKQENNLQNMERIRQEMDDQQNRSGGLAAQIEQSQNRIAVLQAQREQLQQTLQKTMESAKALSDAASEMDADLLRSHGRQTAFLAKAAEKRAELNALTMSAPVHAGAHGKSQAGPGSRACAPAGNFAAGTGVPSTTAGSAGRSGSRLKHDRRLYAAPEGAAGKERSTGAGAERGQSGLGHDRAPDAPAPGDGAGI